MSEQSDFALCLWTGCFLLGVMWMLPTTLAMAEAPLRIMPLGDSITVGYAAGWDPFTFGYRGPLYTRLTNAGEHIQYVGESRQPWDNLFGWGVPTNIAGPNLDSLGQDCHRGYGGDRIGDIAANVVNWLNADAPDVILLMVGINDTYDHTPVAQNG